MAFRFRQFVLVLAPVGMAVMAAPAFAQEPCQSIAAPESAAAAPSGGAGEPNGSDVAQLAGTRASFLLEHPPDYVIGADDMLAIRFWREEQMNADVVVRPDGKITLPLINDIQAAGLTPIALCQSITQAARRLLNAPVVSVIVKEINSRKVYIVGQVAKPGPYEMSAQMTVVHLITMAGGLGEFADKENITVLRTEAGQQLSYRVNYKDIARGKNLKQNISLKPGDTVIVN